jgi:hypothetical protein
VIGQERQVLDAVMALDSVWAADRHHGFDRIGPTGVLDADLAGRATNHWCSAAW